VLHTLLEAAESARPVIAAGSLDVLVGAMREYPVGHSGGIAADMQAGALEIISQFQFEERNLGTKLEDFMNLVEGGMRSFRSKMSLQINGAKILRYCVMQGGNVEVFLQKTRHEDKNKWGMWDWYDHAATLSSGLRTWVKSVELIQDITFLFRVLSERPYSLEMFIHQELVPPFVLAINTQMQDAQTCENILAVIANILATPDLVKPLVDEGFCPIMFKVLEIHSKQPTIIQIIFIIFQRLVAHDGSTRQILLDAKAAQVIQNIVNQYAHEPTVQQQGMGAIQLLFEGMAAT